MLVLLAMACGDQAPVDGECVEDADCLEQLSVELPFCDPEGLCVECTDNDHCESDERCYDGVCDVANCNTADC